MLAVAPLPNSRCPLVYTLAYNKALSSPPPHPPLVRLHFLTGSSLALVADLGVQVCHPEELLAARSRDFSWGVDVCIDCSGAAPAMECAVNLLRAGGKLLVFGVAAPHARMSISPYEIYKKELTILGVMVNPFSFNKSIGFLEAMGDKYLNFDKLGVRVYQLNQYEEAMQELRNRNISKAVFQVSA
ncbi:D-altritol 5-dehydrogenase [Frankliniella occidentalis]|uniref:D-altritol 5-dehydrogenase n=1 Tax=Frankliniella occidentalis TaxID=133901 RepID=A0A9C6XDX9_FRAOC|nr:D-altritol 5-dehydrogenase [Frankliniella occidentalis]